MKHIDLNTQEEAIQRFFQSLPVDREGALVELKGHPVARVLPVGNGVRAVQQYAGPWTEAKNARRCELVDREIEGTLMPEEAAELAVLQEQMLQERRRLAPVPLEDLQKLHQKLLEKAQQQAAQDGA